jgi:hypothetical protein
MARILDNAWDALSALARPEDRVLWGLVALVVAYLVLGVVAARRSGLHGRAGSASVPRPSGL